MQSWRRRFHHPPQLVLRPQAETTTAEEYTPPVCANLIFDYIRDVVYHPSADAGDSWQVPQTGYPEIQRGFPGSIAISPSDTRNVFVGTRQGHIYESTNTGDSWEDLGIHVPPVMAMAVTSA